MQYLRTNKKLTQVELSTRLEIPMKRYQSYEEGRAEPDLHTSVLIADFYKVELKKMITKQLMVNSLRVNQSVTK